MLSVHISHDKPERIAINENSRVSEMGDQFRGTRLNELVVALTGSTATQEIESIPRAEAGYLRHWLSTTNVDVGE